MKKFVYRLKNNVKDFTINFKEKFRESKEKPKSKRKSFLVGFTTAISIFGVTLFGPALSAVAKDIQKAGPKPTDSPVPSQEIINGLAGVAASVCGIAVTTGSFALGIACGVIVAIGILKSQGK